MAPDIPESVVVGGVPRAYAVTWNDLPVAVDLHVLRPAWERRWQESALGAMGGRTASPAFGPVVAEADVHWRLVAATGTGLYADDAAARDLRWRDAALDGAALAADRWARETLAAAPSLQTVRVLAWMIAAPGVTFEERPDGAFRVAPAVVVPGEAARARVEAVTPEDALPERRPRRGGALRLAAGAGWEVQAREPAPVAVAPWVSLARGGLRARGDLNLATGAWGLTTRVPGPRTFAAVASLASRAADDAVRGLVVAPRPVGRAAGGVAWALAPGWELRLEGIAGPEAPADVWLTLRSERRTPAPARARPPLGARVGPDDRSRLHDGSPNQLTWWRP
jgi:hypothetical protein